MLDGLGKVREYVARAVELGQSAQAITDHGTVSGAWEHYTTCRKAGINSILGCEFYFHPTATQAKELKDRDRYHVTVLARNRAGFKTLTELVTEANKRFYTKPLLERSLLESLGDEADNLVCLSGCAGSIISKEAMKSLDEGLDEAKWWRSVFPNFFIEIMAHGSTNETKLNDRLLKIGRRLGIEPVITNDPHYVHKKEHCCPAGTLVDTPFGKTKIEDLKEGDTVWGFDHYLQKVVPSKVIRSFNSSVGRHELFGTTNLQTTGGHPWWINNGYIEVRNLWNRSDSKTFGSETWQKTLQSRLCQHGKQRNLGSSLPQNKQRPGNKEKGRRDKEAQRYNSQQLERWTRTSNQSGTSVVGVQTEVADRSGYFYGEHNVSILVLRGHSFNTEESCCGSGRPVSQSTEDKGSRQEARQVVPQTRMESISIHKCGSACGCPSGSTANQVFNIETETNNYFAGGILVHNSHHDALLAIQTASDIDDPTRFHFDGTGFHLRSRKELANAFRKYRASVVQTGLDNTLRIAEMCRIDIPEWNNKNWHIPRYPKLPEKYQGDSNRYLRRLTMRSLKERKLDSNGRYTARAKHELASFAEVDKMADFLLITYEAIRWARKHDIEVGPGRGSITGSLVAYLLGIHELDSVRYKLLFERFLNPERPKAPDVDSDFEPDGRPLVIQHYSDLYGDENVMRVAAFQKMAIASVFQTLARAHGISPQDRNRLTKKLGQFSASDDEDDQLEEDINVLPEEIRETYPDMAVQMRHLLGTKRAISRHAAGVIIFDPEDSIKELVGLQWLVNKSAPGGGNWTSQFDLKSVSGMNLMKQDTLGLRTLATIKECVRLVKENHGVELDYKSWIPDEEPDDNKIYAMLAEGNTAGIFQAEGPSNTRGLREVKPTCFEDLAIITALYRKGPIDAGSDKRFLRNREDNKVRVIHPSLKPILTHTWGEMIYDEDMLKILKEVAGLSWARVDDVKNAMKLKDPKMMAEIMPDVIDGFIKHSGMKRKQAQEAAAMIEAQSSYLFSRNHAIAYSLSTYRTARLKFLYPLEYMTALVRTVKPSSPKQKIRRMNYVSEISEMGFKVLPPDINRSEAKATCGWDKGKGWFHFGFTDCSGIGDSKAKKLLEARVTEPVGFFGVEDVEEATDKGTFKVLARVGALASIGGPVSSQRLKQEIVGYRFIDPMKKMRKRLRKKMVLPQDDKDYVRIYGEIVSIEHRETRNGKSFTSWQVQWSPLNTWKVQIWDDRDGIKVIRKGTIVRVEGEWSAEWSNISINNPEDVTVIKETKK